MTESSQDMVERVAAAICGQSWFELPYRHREKYRLLAHDAIEAMREPTEAMAIAGFEMVMTSDLNCREDPLHSVAIQTTSGRDAWHAMIDTALAKSHGETP